MISHVLSVYFLWNQPFITFLMMMISAPSSDVRLWRHWWHRLEKSGNGVPHYLTLLTCSKLNWKIHSLVHWRGGRGLVVERTRVEAPTPRDPYRWLHPAIRQSWGIYNFTASYLIAFYLISIFEYKICRNQYVIWKFLFIIWSS